MESTTIKESEIPPEIFIPDDLPAKYDLNQDITKCVVSQLNNQKRIANNLYSFTAINLYFIQFGIICKIWQIKFFVKTRFVSSSYPNFGLY